MNTVIMSDDVIQTMYNQSTIGFMWSDFDLNSTSSFTVQQNDARLIYPEILCKAWHDFIFQQSQTSIVGVMRSHQHTEQSVHLIVNKSPHSGMWPCWMHDSVKTTLWNNIVMTLNLCPNTTLGQSQAFTFDTYVRLTVGTKFDTDWRYQVLNRNVIEKGSSFNEYQHYTEAPPGNEYTHNK
jgi:hypothetical protein